MDIARRPVFQREQEDLSLSRILPSIGQALGRLGSVLAGVAEVEAVGGGLKLVSVDNVSSFF